MQYNLYYKIYNITLCNTINTIQLNITLCNIIYTLKYIINIA